MSQTKKKILAARVQPKRDTVRERGRSDRPLPYGQEPLRGAAERQRSRRRPALNTEQLKAYHRGEEDFARGRRNTNPPYGFSDLKAAWKQGWMAARGKV